MRPGLSRRFVRDWLVPQWRWFALGTTFSAVTAAAAYGYAQIVKLAIDWLNSADPRVFTVAPLAIVVLVFIRAPSSYGQTQANNTGVQRAMIHLQDALFGSLIEGDFARLQASASGEYVSQFTNDMALIREASLRLATNLAKSVLTILASIIFMLTTDWALTLLLVVVYPIAFWPVVRLGERIRKTSRRSQEQIGALTAQIGEAFQGARTVKAYGLEDYQRGRALAGFSERSRLYMKILGNRALVDPFLEAIGGLAAAGLFAFAGWRAMSGASSAGELVGFIVAIAAASPEVRALGTLNSVLGEGLAAADRVYAAIDAKRTIVDEPDAVALDTSEGKVDLVDVHFSYPGASPALQGLSLSAEPGQTVALVGASGSGKSTVFNVLLRLYDVASGSVKLDGHDVRGLKLSSLRRNIALVSQDAFLFDATIEENIRLGHPGATESEIRDAAQAAACDFIESLPQGWKTQAGEGGRNLSGGQRQRVALARALLSKAPVLLLDEATSALDSESESRVQAALANIAGRKTILVIAHRLATVRRADRIFVIDAGKVIESGSHDELIARSGAYARLAELQLS
ncbi:MAG: ATP-binding cassette domain-containing protein [Alphaproteobacteria bacterium]|nr:ATP-binding cassette domain-containing protein [Alphaproteobacteria bacterium]